MKSRPTWSLEGAVGSVARSVVTILVLPHMRRKTTLFNASHLFVLAAPAPLRVNSLILEGVLLCFVLVCLDGCVLFCVCSLE